MESKESSRSTCVREGSCGASSAEFELGDSVDWVPDDEAGGDDLIWVQDDEENGVDVEADGDEDVIIEEVIEGGDHGQDEARVEELEESDEEVENGFERKKMDEATIRKVHEMVDYEGIAADGGTERFIFENRIKAARFWKGQVEVYETKIDDLKTKLENVIEGFRAAIRQERKEKQNNIALTKRNVELISEKWRLSERVARLIEESLQKELTYEAGKRQKRTYIRGLKAELNAEKKKNAELRLDLNNAVKRLHELAKINAPRRNKKRVTREMVSRYVEDEEEESSYLPTSEDEDSSDNSGITRVATTVTNDFCILINDYGN